jgi:hypothetical protein
VSEVPEIPAPPKTARRTLRFALTVTAAPSDESAAGSVAHLGPADRAASASILSALAALDEAKRAVERAKSTLEAFVYAARDRIEASASAEEGDSLAAVSTEEQRDAVNSALAEAVEWLYDDGEWGMTTLLVAGTDETCLFPARWTSRHISIRARAGSSADVPTYEAKLSSVKVCACVYVCVCVN